MNIGIIGSGNIGNTIFELLSKTTHSIEIVDKNPAFNSQYLDVLNTIELNHFIKTKDIIIACTPFFLNKQIAKSCFDNEVAYFDLTEDIETTAYIQNLDPKNFMMPQCGLAPGAVNIIANHLIQQFTDVESAFLRVGALPRYTNNQMAYYLTWSTHGLLNEYCNPCDSIINGKLTKIPGMSNKETIFIDGMMYEAFSTSGGIGTLCETYKNKIQTLDYKTIRYPGHYDIMKFLVTDLSLDQNIDNFVSIFDKEVPYTTEDVVVIMVKVVGRIQNKLIEKTYFKKIYGTDQHSAIQLTTASGLCSNVLNYIKNPKSGFFKQEQVTWDEFTNNKFGKIYV